MVTTVMGEVQSALGNKRDTIQNLNFMEGFLEEINFNRKFESK